MKKFLSVALVAILCFSMAGCNKRVANDPQTLEVYVTNFGYGTDWYEPIMKAFQEEDWVKEKYPDLKVPKPQINSERSFSVNRVLGGTSNTIDLFFTTESNKSKIEEKVGGQRAFEDLTKDVYEQKVPGEDVIFKNKVQPDFLKMVDTELLDGTRGYFAVKWVAGSKGMLYNKTEFDKNGYKIPRTTDELSELCEQIVNDKKVPFVFSTAEDGWWYTMFPIWWAQYEGVENYAHYYEGLVPDPVEEGRYELSRAVVAQEGRLKALEFMETLLGSTQIDNKGNRTNNKYVHPDCNSLNFTEAQTYFLQGKGLMQPNGDWFQTEMNDIASEGITDVITFMATPVLSSITDKTPTIRENGGDAKLREVIDAVDRGETSVAEVSAEDFAKVKEARGIAYSIEGHTAFIPSYSTAKEVAKDFLRFLATDKANKIFSHVMFGASMPFIYDVETKDPEFYNDGISQLHKDRLISLKTVNYLPMAECYPLSYYGGLNTLAGGAGIATSFCVKNSNEYKTAREIYQSAVDYWNETRWNNALISAGMK